MTSEKSFEVRFGGGGNGPTAGEGGDARLMTEKAAARYLAMSVRYLRKARYAPGEGTPGPGYIKIGKSVRYDRADLDQWIELRKRDRLTDRRN